MGVRGGMTRLLGRTRRAGTTRRAGPPSAGLLRLRARPAVAPSSRGCRGNAASRCRTRERAPG